MRRLNLCALTVLRAARIPSALCVSSHHREAFGLSRFARWLIIKQHPHCVCSAPALVPAHPQSQRPVVHFQMVNIDSCVFLIIAVLVVNAARKMGHKNVLYVADKNELPERVYEQTSPGDMVICLGAGDIWKCANELAARVNALGQGIAANGLAGGSSE